MNSTIGICPETYKQYLKAYKKKRGNVKYALKFTTFEKKLEDGNTLVVGNHEFMSNNTFSNWLNNEAAMIAIH